MQIRHQTDDRLVFDRDGATWNFSAAPSGTLHLRIKPLEGGQGGRICLLDRWINPTDPYVENYSMYVLRFDGDGRVDGKPLLDVGQWSTLDFTWQDASAKHCLLQNEQTGLSLKLPLRHPSRDGISYIHFQSWTDEEDPHGFLIESVEAKRTTKTCTKQ